MANGNRMNEWKLGLFVVGGTLLAIASITWLAASRLKRETFETVSYFDESVEGLEVGSPVKFRGVSIGQVRTITIAGDRRHVAVTAAIYAEVVRQLGLTEYLGNRAMGEEDGFRSQLVTSPLTGVSFVQCDFFDNRTLERQSLPFETAPNVIYTVPSTIKSLEQGLAEAIRSIPRVADRVISLLDRAEQTLDDAQIGEIMTSLRNLLGELDRSVRGLDGPSLFTRGEQVLGEVEGAVVAFRSLVDDLRAEDGALSRVEQLIHDADIPATTASIRGVGDGTRVASEEISLLVRELRGQLDVVVESLAAMRDLARTLERQPDALLRGREVRPLPDAR